MNIRLGIFCFVVASIATVPSHAQIYTPPFNFNPQIGSRIVQPQLDAQQRRNNETQRSNKIVPFALPSTKLQKGFEISQLSYVSSETRRKENLKGFVEKMRAQDPVGAAQMQQLFSSMDVLNEIGRGIAPYGLKTDNVADAYAVYWMTAWQAANNDTSDFTRTQTNAVKRQAANAMLVTHEFISANNSVKQEMAEAYLVQAALIQAAADVAQTNRAIADGLPEAVRQGAKASGLDLDMMVLTDEGFKPRKGSDASDAVPPAPGDEAEALADAGMATDDTTNYALIAAAGAGTLVTAFGLRKVMGRRG